MVNTARGAMSERVVLSCQPVLARQRRGSERQRWPVRPGRELPDNCRNQIDCPPEFEFNSFHDNQLAGAVGRNDENMQWGDTFSWYKPDMGGDHDFKFGGTFHRSPVETVTESDMGGTFRFDTDSLFNSADPTTYPERLVVRVGNPGGYVYDFTMTTWELFFQDKWAVSDRLTLGLGIRYDLELWRSADSGITVNPVTRPRRPDRPEQHLTPHVVCLRYRGRRPVGSARGLRDVLRQDPRPAGRRFRGKDHVLAVVHDLLPTEPGRSRARGRGVPDRAAPAEFRARHWGAHRGRDKRVSGKPRRRLPVCRP